MGARQRGSLRYLLPHLEAHNPNLWRFEPLGKCSNEWSHLLLALPRTAQLRPPQDCRELDPVPSPPLLYDRVRPFDIAWFATVSCVDRARVDSADVRCKEYDVRR